MATPASLHDYSRRELWLSRGLALLSLSLFIYWLQEYLREVPDSYHNQHLRGMLLTLAMLSQNIAPSFKLKRGGWGLMGLSMALLGGCFWLSVR